METSSLPLAMPLPSVSSLDSRLRREVGGAVAGLPHRIAYQTWLLSGAVIVAMSIRR